MSINKLLINEPPLQALPSLAVALKSLDAAVILQQIHYWIIHPSAPEREGRRWHYATFPEWQLQFPWASLSTIKRLIAKMEKMNLLISKPFNEHKGDCTKWYTVNYEAVENLSISSRTYDPKPTAPPKVKMTLCSTQGFQEDTPSVKMTPPSGQNETCLRSKWNDVIKEKETTKEIIKDIKENKQKKDSARPQVADAVSLVFEHWQKVMNHPKAVLDKKRKRHLEEALAKYSVDELKQAIDGCASNEWYMGKNDRGTVFDAIHVIFKDSDKIEGFIRMAFVKPKPIPTKSDYHQNVNNAFANVMLELSCVGGLSHGAI